MARRGSAALLACAALALTGCEAVTSFETACQKSLAPAQVNVDVAPMDYASNFKLGADELTAKGAANSGRITLGYIETQLKATLSAAGQGKVHPFTRRYCIRPQIGIQLAFAPTTLYVAREQPEGSCEFKVVMDHELQHFREYQAILSDLADRMENDMRARYGEPILYFASAAEAERTLQAQIGAYIAEQGEKMRAEIVTRQGRFDTPEEYFRLERFREACSR
jgi:hypothetical protein